MIFVKMFSFIPIESHHFTGKMFVLLRLLFSFFCLFGFFFVCLGYPGMTTLEVVYVQEEIQSSAKAS